MQSSRLQTWRTATRLSLGRLRELTSRRAPWLAMFAFALLVSYAYTDPQAERLAPARPEAHGDGLYYYAYLRSIAFDHDVDFSNDYHLLGDQFHAGINPISKRPQNVFTVGPALFWLPLVPVAVLARDVTEWLGAPHQKPDGTDIDFQRIVLYGSTLAGLLATALMLALALRVTDPTLATLASIGLCLGSPLIWFMLRQPSFSHATDACAVALFASAWLVSYGSRSLLRWVGLGVLLGLAMMVRPQNVANVLLPLTEWLIAAYALRKREAEARAEWIVTGALFVLAVLFAFSPLLLIWHSLYGKWTLVPQGQDFMLWGDSRWSASLFASRGGLFAWHPLILLSVVGLFVLACSRRYARELRLFAALGLLVLLTQSYINGSAKDWWGGWAFGGRRFLSCTIYFGVGLAGILETFRRFVVERPLRFAKLCAALGLAVAVLYNRSLADDYFRSRAAADQPQPMKARYAQFLNRTLDEGYALTGNPGSWPANLWFALRAHTSPEKFDVAAAADLADYPHAIAFWHDTHSMGGFDPAPVEWGGKRVRLAHEKQLTWVVALRQRVGIHARITLAASAPNTRVIMRIDGHEVLKKKLTTSWADYTFELPGPETHAGLIYVEVEQKLPSKDAFTAWDQVFFTFEKAPLED